MSDKYDDDDLELENAIGDVFKNFDMYNVEKTDQNEASEPPQDEQQTHEGESYHAQESTNNAQNVEVSGQQSEHDHFTFTEGDGGDQSVHGRDLNDDIGGSLDDDELELNFDDAINDAFKSLQDTEIRQEEEVQGVEEDRENEPERGEEEEESLQEEDKQGEEGATNNDNDNNNDNENDPHDPHDPHDKPENNDHSSHTPSEVPINASNEHEHEHENEDDDLDLANAISNALQSINTIQDDVQEPSEDHDKEYNERMNLTEAQAGKESTTDNTDVYSPLQMEKHYDEEQGVQSEDEDMDLQNAIGNAFESLKKSNQLGDQDLSQVITDSLQQLTGGEDVEQFRQQKTQELQTRLKETGQISDDLLQELAKEITSKVSEIDDHSKNKNKFLDLPKIDDQVLDHFVNEANKSKQTEIPHEGTSSQELGGESSSGTDTDAKQDDMLLDDDDQLQSTIAKAVKSLISEQKEPKEDNLNNLQMNDILTNAFNMAMENPTELLNNLEADEIRNREDLLKDSDISKRLSILDTLNVRRPLDLNNQLSSMMLSLSKNSDSNLITVIKSLTNFLTNSNFQIFKNSQSLISIINQYKNNDFEKMFVNGLNLSKNYLRTNSKTKCIVAIDNILILFGKSTTGDILNYNFNLITLITNSIISCITNFSNLKNFKNTIFKKPRLSNLEYKEKIRIENRERKKRWREENKERNKDNDLRSRVIKRANAMYGSEDSKEKSEWVEAEFTRRRERRQVKQSKGSGSDSLSGNSSKEFDNEQFIQDKNLVQLVTDFFNIFSNFAPKDDSETGLFTTAVTIASISIIYLLNFSPSFEFKRVDTIVTSIMNNLLNAFNSIDQQERLIYLARGSNVKNNMDYDDSVSFDVDPSLSSQSASVKEPEPEKEENPVKRPKVSKQENLVTANLKFPSYKSNETKKPLAPPSSSGLSVNLHNLKKPGTFKRPNYGDKKAKSLGFPPFYSTSIKH